MPMGQNKIDTLMKCMVANSPLSNQSSTKKLTNHSARKTLPSGYKDVRKTSKGRLFRTRGRPIRASNGRPLDGPNATRYVHPNWTSRDVQFGLALDVIVKPPKVKWTSKGRLKTS